MVCHRNKVYIVYMCAVFGEMKMTRRPLLNVCCNWDVCDLWVCIYPQWQQGFFLTTQKGKCPRMPLSETGLSLLLTSNPMELFQLTESNTSDASWFQTLFDVPLWRSRIHFLSECLSHFEAKYLQWAHEENTWHIKKKKS